MPMPRMAWAEPLSYAAANPHEAVLQLWLAALRNE